MLPYAAMPEKLFVSSRIVGHGAFFDCTEFGGAKRRKLVELFRQVTNDVDVPSGCLLALLNFDTLKWK